MSTRALGIDLGSKRIGVALSNTDQTVATPLQTVQRLRDQVATHRTLVELATEWEVGVVVIGVPYSLDGSVGPSAAGVLAEIELLRATFRVPVELYDERLTTVTAQRSIQEMGLPPSTRRDVVDQIAASVLLQGWLDQQRSGAAPSQDTP